MATLVLMRHAAAEAAPPGMRDFDRPLAAEGRAEAVAAAKRMRAEGLVVDCILHSAAVRTTETARLVAGVIGVAPERVRAEDDLYNASATTLDRFARLALESLGARATLLLVAHNPGISDCAAAHAAPSRGRHPASMKTAEFRVFRVAKATGG